MCLLSHHSAPSLPAQILEYNSYSTPNPISTKIFLDQTDPSSSQSSQFGILRCTKRQHPLLQIYDQKGIEHKMHSTEDYYIHLLLIFYKEIHLIIGTCDWLSITNIKCINLQFFLHLIISGYPIHVVAILQFSTCHLKTLNNIRMPECIAYTKHRQSSE